MPAKTPQPIGDRLATEMQAVLKEPAVIKRWEEIGAEGSTMTPAEVTLLSGIGKRRLSSAKITVTAGRSLGRRSWKPACSDVRFTTPA